MVRSALRSSGADDPWFPEEGYSAGVNYYGATTALGSAVNYQRLQATGSFAFSWGANTINLYASGGTDFNSNMPAYESFALGGPLRLSGFRLNQFSGHEYAFGRAMYYRRILPLPELLGSGVYAGASAEVGNVRVRPDSMLPSPGSLYSGSVFLGANTFAGPTFFGAGFGTGNAFSIFLLLDCRSARVANRPAFRWSHSARLKPRLRGDSRLPA